MLFDQHLSCRVFEIYWNKPVVLESVLPNIPKPKLASITNRNHIHLLSRHVFPCPPSPQHSVLWQVPQMASPVDRLLVQDPEWVQWLLEGHRNDHPWILLEQLVATPKMVVGQAQHFQGAPVLPQNRNHLRRCPGDWAHDCQRIEGNFFNIGTIDNIDISMNCKAVTHVMKTVIKFVLAYLRSYGRKSRVQTRKKFWIMVVGKLSRPEKNEFGSSTDSIDCFSSLPRISSTCACKAIGFFEVTCLLTDLLQDVEKSNCTTTKFAAQPRVLVWGLKPCLGSHGPWKPQLR